MADNRIKIVRNHVVIELEHAYFRFSISDIPNCKQSIVINKIETDGGSSQLCIGAKYGNEVEVF